MPQGTLVRVPLKKCPPRSEAQGWRRPVERCLAPCFAIGTLAPFGRQRRCLSNRGIKWQMGSMWPPSAASSRYP